MQIHHLGLVVTDVDEALSALGLARSAIREKVFDPVQKNNLYFIYLEHNRLWLELVEPTEPGASTYTFAKKNGLGLHHLGMETRDLRASEQEYGKRPACFTLGRYRIEVKSFGGRIRTLFVAFKGLILEFVKVDD